jgi:tetratricopeptide (TPR) repeat protein/class 3 adenylate cyclase
MPANQNPPTHSHPTFLFTDIVDSSMLASAFGHPAYVAKLQGPHDVVLREAIEKYHGYEGGTAGDSFFVVFEKAGEALDCAREMQERLHQTPLTATDVNGATHTLAVRIGVHTAEREVSFDAENHYRSLPDVNFAARVMGQAGAGQIFVSQETRKVAGNAAACKWHTWTYCFLKGAEEALQTLYELLWDGGETRGDPKERHIPPTFRIQKNRYIARPELETSILTHLEGLPGRAELASLVTLWGGGGMGKTRLAVTCVLRAGRVFPDGVYFVSLADRVPSAQSVVEAIGAALGLERVVQPQDLLPALREKSLLLVLDNYESVLCDEARDCLRFLLNETNRLRLLLTSREAAHIPMVEKQVEVKGLTDAQAQELFLDRARLQPNRDGWQPTTEPEHAALTRILELTERIPLAIELLAAWMGLREIGQIARELEATPLPAMPEGFTNIDAAERNQSLSRCFDYSYNLLDAPLKRGFAVLSLFADTFDAESATAACALTDTQRMLDQLYLKALITRSADAEGQNRYAMLRPTRAFAADRFNALPDAADLRTRYIVHYRQLVIDNHGINDLGKQAVLEREWRNALAAADHTEAAGDAGSLNTLSKYLVEFLLLRGWWSENERLNRRALEATRRSGDRQAEGRVLNNLGSVYGAQSKWQEAIECFQQNLVIEREFGDRVGEGTTIMNLGSVYYSQGKWQEAIECYQQSLGIRREYGDRVGEGQTLNNLGLVYDTQGKWQEAINCYEQDLAICREYGDRVGEGKTLNNLGDVYRAQGKWQEAIDCNQQSLGIEREYGDRVGEGATLNNLGSVYDAQGKWQEAIECYQQSLAICREYGDRVGEGRALNNLGGVYYNQGKRQEALDCFQQSMAICREYSDPVGEGKTLENIALLYNAQGDTAKALEWERQALQVLETTEDRRAIEKARSLIAMWEGTKPRRRWWPFGR